ncbi:MAG: hypothetical protein Fues2KO_21440 [Fuerstiella sp.]
MNNSFFHTTPFFVCLLFSLQTFADENERPNILLIMADDLGVEGLGCYGGTSYRTPNLDRLAAGGLQFTAAYAQPLCTPTRVQIMTGRYNHRNWTYFGILPPEESTFGHHLQRAGYRTGIFGKWQLQSYDPPDLPNADARRGTGLHPKDAGFDRYALFHALHTEDKGSRYANPTMLEGKANQPGTLKTYPGRYGENVWVEKIVDFLKQPSDRPAFVYYPMALPHRPFEPTPESDEWNPRNVPEEDVRFVTDMVEYMDTAVGRLVEQLDQHNLRKNTLVLFYSDNGFHRAVYSRLNDGRIIRGGKGESLQTGIHVPLIANWPGRIPPNSTDRIVDASDFVPTLCELAGTQAPENSDGVSFAPLLFGDDGPERTAAFFWYDPRPGWDKERFRRSVFAVDHDYKLFRDGRLFRLGPDMLQETAVDPLQMTPKDEAARNRLQQVITEQLAEGEPPLVDAYGRPEIDLLHFPEDRQASDRICDQILQSAEQISYGEAPPQKMWIFKPLDLQSDDERRPCVFFIHGGGWAGHPRAFAPQCAYLQRRGYVTASIHFRAPRAPLTPHDSLRDARSAWRWLLDHGDQFNIDPNQMFVSGGSAGGHLSLALSTITLPDDPVIERLPKGYVLFNPVIDLVDGWDGGQKKLDKANIDHRSFSPAHQVRPGLPPTLILSGSDDPLITPQQIKAFQDRMQQAGNRCEFIEYPNAGHGFFNYGRERNQYFHWTMWEFVRFLDELQE